MSTTTPTRSAADPALDGDIRLEPPGGQRRRRRLSWIAIGVAVALAAGVLGAVTIARVADRQSVVALAVPIERGQSVTADDLTTVRVASDAVVDLTPAQDLRGLVGLVATSDLPAGTLIQAGLLASAPVVPSGWTVVGLALEPGAYPTNDLAIGDLVTVVRTPDAVTGTAGADDKPVTLAQAQVYDVQPLSDTAQTLMVSITVPEDRGADVAAAAAQDRVRLLLEAPR